VLNDLRILGAHHRQRAVGRVRRHDRDLAVLAADTQSLSPVERPALVEIVQQPEQPVQAARHA
jgi:hypothetical protein